MINYEWSEVHSAVALTVICGYLNYQTSFEYLVLLKWGGIDGSISLW